MSDLGTLDTLIYGIRRLVYGGSELPDANTIEVLGDAITAAYDTATKRLKVTVNALTSSEIVDKLEGENVTLGAVTANAVSIGGAASVGSIVTGGEKGAWSATGFANTVSDDSEELPELVHDLESAACVVRVMVIARGVLSGETVGVFKTCRDITLHHDGTSLSVVNTSVIGTDVNAFSAYGTPVIAPYAAEGKVHWTCAGPPSKPLNWAIFMTVVAVS